MLALCLMLLATYYALNYASIIGRGLATEGLELLGLKVCPHRILWQICHYYFCVQLWAL